MNDEYEVAGHAFVSYVREDSLAVDRLQRVLEAAGVRVWRDTADLWPGEDWRARIRRAITDDALAFIACFSCNSVSRSKSYQNEEITLAIEQLRQRRPDDSWLIPVRFDDCDISDWDIGGGRTLGSIQRADLFGDREGEGIARLVAAVLRILGRNAAARVRSSSSDTAPRPADHGVVTGLVGLPQELGAPTHIPDVRAIVYNQADAMPAITDRWRLTYSPVDAPAMMRLVDQNFDHPAYRRPADGTPPWVRLSAVVACEELGEAPRWQDLRGRFTGWLAQKSIRGLINELTYVPDCATWRPRGTLRRSWLAADLTVTDETIVPAASAILFLPENDTPAGIQPGCAQLIIHVDFVRRAMTLPAGPMPAQQPSFWRSRFAQALALPGELATWLELQLSLATSSLPVAQSGIMLQASGPLTEMVDISGIQSLPTPWTSSHFTGWAVADADGKTVQDLASQVMLDLSERVLHLDGSVEQMSGLT